MIVPTPIWRLQLRSGSAHCDLALAVDRGPVVPTAALAVGVRQYPLRSGTCSRSRRRRKRWRRRRGGGGGRREKGGGNPHLAGGEKDGKSSASSNMVTSLFIYCNGSTFYVKEFVGS